MSDHGDGEPALLEEPVWYEPLRSPAWLLPRVLDDAPRISIAPAVAAAGATGAGALAVGAALFLAEAVRYSTDARVVAGTGPWAPTTGVAGIVRLDLADEDGTRTVRARVTDADDAPVADLTFDAVDDAGFGATLAGLPSQLTGALGAVGVRAVWSTIYTPPPAEHVVAYIRAHRACSWLRNPAVHRADPNDVEGSKERRAMVVAALDLLSRVASRSKHVFGIALFLGGLAATKAAGSDAHLEHRLSANSLAMRTEDPKDPAFGLSVFALSLFGDGGAVDRRVAQLADADDDLRKWLLRARAAG